MDVNANGEDAAGERAEIHFLAALIDELMRKMLARGVLTKSEMNEIEQSVAQRIGGSPRAW